MTLLYNQRALYNPIEEEIERLINPTTGFLEEAVPTLAQETGKLTTDFNAATADYDVLVNPNSEYLKEVPPLKRRKTLEMVSYPNLKVRWKPAQLMIPNQ